jgi:protein-S-isoprenylcysteine O-methyltransferase Ste14
MKERIKVDHSILFFTIIITILLYQFPFLYPQNKFLNTVFDVIGFICILKGIYCRMAARGHKMAYSRRGNGLVVTGLYKYVRNPMYLGTLIMGGGYVLLVWPWWTLPLFVWFFYLRFKPQMVKEEIHLKKLFGEAYDDYFQRVPRLIPTLQSLKNMNVREAFPLKETWNTRERRGFILWPSLAFILESFQRQWLFHRIDFFEMMILFILSVIVFTAGFWLQYKKSPFVNPPV